VATRSTVRLQKFLADAGLCSRREAEEWILDGRVEVNGKPILRLGVAIDPVADHVRCDGQRVRLRKRYHYLMLHKPRRVVCTVKDDRERPTVIDCLPANTPRLFPVGRLDYDTEGLLLLTDDGDLTARLTHPRYGVEKVYHVRISRHPTAGEMARIRRGVRLDDGPARPTRVRLLKKNPRSAWLEVAFREGRNRLVRRYMQRCGLLVERLIRVGEGPLTLGELAPGAYRPLTRQELASLRRAVGPRERS
jgi:23S rRNA pseudouridine2605 synthase